LKPYPVLDAVKQAFAPIGVAFETTQRRFYAGDEASFVLRVTNDDESFKDQSDLTVQVELNTGSKAARKPATTQIAKLPYYATTQASVKLAMPKQINGSRQKATLTARVMSGKKELSRSDEQIELFIKPPTSKPAVPSNVIVIKRGQPLMPLLKGGDIYERVAAGATAIVLSPANEDIAYLFPKALFNDEVERERDRRAATTRAATRRAATTQRAGHKPPASRKSATTTSSVATAGAATRPATQAAERREQYVEFADFSTAAGTRLTQNLQPMDIKWWTRENDWRAHCGTTSVRLRPDGGGRELIRYIPPHGYIPEEKRPEQYRAVLCEIRIGKGRLWICNLDIEASQSIDPAARIFTDNLYRAAADPQSTNSLPKIPTHEQLLEGATPPAGASPAAASSP
jgi:hypothetical protein